MQQVDTHYQPASRLHWWFMGCIIILRFIPIPKFSNRSVSFPKTASGAIRSHSSHSVPVLVTVSVSFLKELLCILFSLIAIWNFSGQKYGILEIKVVLANLLRRFRFSVKDASTPMLIPSSEVVLKPKKGVPLILSKREIIAWVLIWNPLKRKLLCQLKTQSVFYFLLKVVKWAVFATNNIIFFIIWNRRWYNLFDKLSRLLSRGFL